MKLLLPRYLSAVSFVLILLGGCATPSAPVSEPVSENYVDESGLTSESGSVDPTADAPDPGLSGQVETKTLTAASPPREPVETSENPTLQTALIDTQLPEQESTRPPVDLWERLRNDFALGTLAGSEELVKRHENWFRANPEYFERLGERGYWLLPYVLTEVEERGMPGEIALLPAVESAYRHEATSRSNAAGLWQLISATGTRFGLRQDWWMDARRDMVDSTRAALDYLEFLHDHFNGDWELAIAAYNAGEGTIRKAVARNRSSGKATNFSALDLRTETTQYVPKLIALRNVIAQPERFNIALKPIPDIQTLSIVDAGMQTDLTLAASLIPVSTKTLRGFNRGYRRGVTPPEGPHRIVVPSKNAQALELGLARLSRDERMRWALHQVRKGEYLGRIARDYNVSVNSIVTANRLNSHLIHPGQELKIPISSGYGNVPQFSASDLEVQDGDTIYTVREGDSLWEISRNTGVTIASLLRWNDITKDTTLFPGQRLIVRKST